MSPDPTQGRRTAGPTEWLLTLGPDEHVTPLAAPSARIAVADFLP